MTDQKQAEAIQRLMESSSKTIDLTDERDLAEVTRVTEEILALFPNRESLEALEKRLISNATG